MTNNGKSSILSTVPSTMMDHKPLDLVVVALRGTDMYHFLAMCTVTASAIEDHLD